MDKKESICTFLRGFQEGINLVTQLLEDDEFFEDGFEFEDVQEIDSDAADEIDEILRKHSKRNKKVKGND